MANYRLLLLFFSLISLSFGDDSLKDALNAVNRRQRDLSDYRRPYEQYYQNERFYNDDGDESSYENLEKLENRQKELEQALVDYFEERGLLNEVAPSSPFRERVEKDHASRQKGRLMSSRRYGAAEEFDDYPEFLAGRHSAEDLARSAYKRSYLGLNSVGMRKRSRAFQPDGPSESLYLLNYAPRDEVFSRLEESSGSPYMWYPPERRGYTMSSYPYAGSHFSKRNRAHFERKRSVKKSKTDPKVEQKLSQIFNAKPENESKPLFTKKPTMTTEKPPRKETAKPEVTTSAPVQTPKPLDMKKKSIDWSDYFGLDRRKKSDSDVENEWLVERDPKAAKKSNSLRDGSIAAPRKYTWADMDEKLKSMEENIIDETVKFTGAHEGGDSKEIEDVKDSIINRLSTAYNLEMMRKALREYKETLGRDENDEESGEIINKRASVARKQAVNDDLKPVTEDNDIKCKHSDANCDEQNYKVPSEIMKQLTFGKGECDKIEKACKYHTASLGPYAPLFEEACNMYQICLLCGNNNWLTPDRQCNILYWSKTDELCDGNHECRQVSKEVIKSLFRANRALRSDLNSTCHLECPDRR